MLIENQKQIELKKTDEYWNSQDGYNTPFINAVIAKIIESNESQATNDALFSPIGLILGMLHVNFNDNGSSFRREVYQGVYRPADLIDYRIGNLFNTIEDDPNSEKRNVIENRIVYFQDMCVTQMLEILVGVRNAEQYNLSLEQQRVEPPPPSSPRRRRQLADDEEDEEDEEDELKAPKAPAAPEEPEEPAAPAEPAEKKDTRTEQQKLLWNRIRSKVTSMTQPEPVLVQPAPEPAAAAGSEDTGTTASSSSSSSSESSRSGGGTGFSFGGTENCSKCGNSVTTAGVRSVDINEKGEPVNLAFCGTSCLGEYNFYNEK